MPKRGRKRANGEGTIAREATGRYRIAISVKAGAKTKRVTRTAWTQADAVRILAELRAKHSRGLVGASGRMTIEAFINGWLDQFVRVELSKNTYTSYSTAARVHIYPRVGSIALEDFRLISVQSFVNQMIDEKVGGRARENAFKVLRAAFTQAKRMELVGTDPFEFAKKPAHDEKEICPFDLKETKAILEMAASPKWKRYHALLHLGLCAGLRQGEIFGLKWKCVLWAKQQVKVELQAVEISGAIELAKPKTPTSIRTVDLTPQTIEALEDHRKLMLAEGHAKPDDLVFPGDGCPFIRRGGFRRWVWSKILDDVGLAVRGFHHTRHTYATLALGAGVPPAVVSLQLGHSKVSTTLDIYGHVLEAHRTTATETMSRLIG